MGGRRREEGSSVGVRWGLCCGKGKPFLAFCKEQRELWWTFEAVSNSPTEGTFSEMPLSPDHTSTVASGCVN